MLFLVLDRTGGVSLLDQRRQFPCSLKVKSVEMAVSRSLSQPCLYNAEQSGYAVQDTRLMVSGKRKGSLEIPRGVLPLSGFQSELLEGEEIRSGTKLIAA